ncbi:hypothetical protein [Anaerocolumna sedimenticola]|uniref:hypothetical protein n=1 Tax=Anaerocolumna sedimenticola TaxID=2696063 RepID=UPI002ED53BB0
MRRRFGFPNSANDTPELLEFFRVLKEDGFLNADKPFSMKVMAYDEFRVRRAEE